MESEHSVIISLIPNVCSFQVKLNQIIYSNIINEKSSLRLDKTIAGASALIQSYKKKQKQNKVSVCEMEGLIEEDL